MKKKQKARKETLVKGRKKLKGMKEGGRKRGGVISLGSMPC